MALSDNLWAHYHLDETSGTRVDSSSNGRDLDGTDVGYAAGKISNAAKLYNNTGQLSVYNQALNWSSGLTIAFWFYLNNSGLAIVRVNLGSFDDDNYIQVSLVLDPSSNVKASLYVKYPDDGTTVGSYETSITANAWHYLVCKVSSSTLKATIDDSEVINTSITLSAASALNWLQVVHTDLTGAYELVDELAIWERALSTDEGTTLLGGGSGLSDFGSGGGGDSLAASLEASASVTAFLGGLNNMLAVIDESSSVDASIANAVTELITATINASATAEGSLEINPNLAGLRCLP